MLTGRLGAGGEGKVGLWIQERLFWLPQRCDVVGKNFSFHSVLAWSDRSVKEPTKGIALAVETRRGYESYAELHEARASGEGDKAKRAPGPLCMCSMHSFVLQLGRINPLSIGPCTGFVAELCWTLDCAHMLSCSYRSSLGQWLAFVRMAHQASRAWMELAPKV
eukprot:633608-Amphidinium_carterae.1